MLILGLIFLILLVCIVWVWVGGIDKMQQEHPDYKGLDLFNEEDKNEIT